METAIERKRRLRRERILQNSESRMRRIVGESASAAASASSPGLPNDAQISNHDCQGADVNDDQDGSSVGANVQPMAESNDGFMASPSDSPHGHVNGEADGGASTLPLTSELNGFHPHLRERAKEMDACHDDTPSAAGAAPALETGAFGFDASKLKRRGGNSNETVTRDELAVEDEELSGAKELLLRDHFADADMLSRRTWPDDRPVSGPSNEGLPKMKRLNANERLSKEETLRDELERLMNHERNPHPQPSAKPSSRTNSTRRKSTSSLWYTKTWFRTTFAILLALFVRVLMQISLSDYFSDSAFYPFFSMELSFFVAAFCAKPPGYRIPIGGGIVEMVTNLLGFSREILGNLKWFYEFAFQKPVEEFSLYFFVFVLSHLILKHVQERTSLPREPNVEL